VNRDGCGQAANAADPFPVGAEQLRRIVESGVVGTVIWDATGDICAANDRFLEIVGYPREDIEARRLGWPRLAPAGWNSRDGGWMDRLRSHGIARAVEQECVRRDGVLVHVKLHSMTLADDCSRILSIVVDVTEQKRAERERDALVERERLARGEAEAAVRARDDILAIVSHDLRNPLNIIGMGVTLLESPAADEARAAQLRLIRRAIAGMNALIDDLMDISRIASGCLTVNPELVDASSLCEDARAMLSPLLNQKAQHFECEVARRPLGVLADPRRIFQVLSNLVGNANKFTPEGGRITLRVETRDGWARFAVADTGPGISRHDLPFIFDRFWQARRVRRGGVGLGLAISKGIIDAHGGSIWAESSAGYGTTFYFTLPLPATPPEP
jgi:PAS domain S-box-containing protein